MSKNFERGTRSCACITVDELRNRLTHFDGTTMVMLPGQEGGFHALGNLDVMPIVLNVNSDPQFGPHDLPSKRQKPHTSVLVLRPGG